jgi:hypothetical protein
LHPETKHQRTDEETETQTKAKSVKNENQTEDTEHLDQSWDGHYHFKTHFHKSLMPAGRLGHEA